MHPKADKSFGQHFLVNQGVIDRIADSVLRISHGKSVIEIGSGPGALTKALLERELKVKAIELDPRMVEHLKQQYDSQIDASHFSILLVDALEHDWSAESVSTVCGNLPYNVGTTIVFELLETAEQSETFCFMLQKEVVQRLVAEKRTKAYGHLSVLFQLLTSGAQTFWVQPGSFSPPPKVESGVIEFSRNSKLMSEKLSPFAENTDYFSFKMALKKAFQNRRKMLRKSFPSLQAENLGSCRPEELSPEDWWQLWESGALS